MGLKGKVGLVAAKASALRINLNIQGCSVVAPPLHAPSHAPLLLPLLLTHNIPLPRINDDPSFIVLTETKFSFRCIPVWDRYSPHRTRVEKSTCDNALTMTSPVHW